MTTAVQQLMALMEAKTQALSTLQKLVTEGSGIVVREAHVVLEVELEDSPANQETRLNRSTCPESCFGTCATGDG